jgi:hypothetical protein
MASKILAAVFAVAVLSVGGYTYWQYADGTHCCATKVQAPEPSTGSPAASLSLPCCQEPSRTSCVSLAPGESCCDDTPAAAGPEVLTIAPREVK